MELILKEAHALFVVLLLLGLFWYLPRLRCWFSAFSKQKRMESKRKNRLAVVIPARNESRSITPLLESLKKQNYPKELYDAQIIVADPADPTIAIAERFGMRVHVVTTQERKGDALDGCLRTLLCEDREKYDAYIIVDADCVLDPDFLLEMNNAMASGCDIITSKKLVKNYFFGNRKSKTLSACCNGVIWTLIDNMGNKYKAAHGYPCFTVGTGLLLSKRMVTALGGWPYCETLTEDMELMHDSVLSGFQTFYYEYAILYMEEAERLAETNKRRRRWMNGVCASERIYGKRVKKAGSMADRYYTSSLNPVYFMVGTAFVYSASMILLSLVLFLFGDPIGLLAAQYGIRAFLLIYVGFFVMTLIALLSDAKYIRLSFPKALLLLFAHPIFYMEYIHIVGRAILFPQEKTWEEIARVDFEEDETETKEKQDG